MSSLLQLIIKKLLMRTIYIILCVLIATVSLSAINCDYDTSSSKSFSRDNKEDKTVKKEERTVEKFNAVGMGISADVKLTQGSPQSLVIEGAVKDLEKIITETDGSTLKIKSKPGSWHVGKVTVYITMEEVKELKISGSGSIVANSAVNTDELYMSVSGSGSINISELTAAILHSHISGSGSIDLAGKGAETKSHDIHISGSGDLSVPELPTQDINVHISGSGNCKVMASNKLTARVSGSGDVYYKGKPVVDAKVSGSGKIKEM